MNMVMSIHGMAGMSDFRRVSPDWGTRIGLHHSVVLGLLIACGCIQWAARTLRKMNSIYWIVKARCSSLCIIKHREGLVLTIEIGILRQSRLVSWESTIISMSPPSSLVVVMVMMMTPIVVVCWVAASSPEMVIYLVMIKGVEELGGWALITIFTWGWGETLEILEHRKLVFIWWTTIKIHEIIS